MAKPKYGGIIIRVSGVRVPPPASGKPRKSWAFSLQRGRWHPLRGDLGRWRPLRPRAAPRRPRGRGSRGAEMGHPAHETCPEGAEVVKAEGRVCRLARNGPEWPRNGPENGYFTREQLAAVFAARTPMRHRWSHEPARRSRCSGARPQQPADRSRADARPPGEYRDEPEEPVGHADELDDAQRDRE
jgi:hypothetical protein